MLTIAQAAAKKEALLEALTAQLGNVSSACKACGINRNYYYILYKEDADFKAQADKVIDIAIDFVESKLMSQINSGDTTAIIFYLKTIGKKRGYVERKEITGIDGSPLIFTIEGVSGIKENPTA